MKLKFFFAVAMLMVAGGAFAATGWVVDPPFDAQRDAYWGFDGGPGTAPYYWGDPEYNGPDDPILYPSDYTGGGGAPVFGWHVRNGNDLYFGLDCNQGYGTGGSAMVHLDNWIVVNPVKYIWLQYDVKLTDGASMAPCLYTDESVYWNLVEKASVASTDGFVTKLYYAEIFPNPPAENFGFSFYAPSGGIAGIDNVRIATACVPEPSLIGLVGLGVLGVLARRKK